MNKFDILALKYERNAIKRIKRQEKLLTCSNVENYIEKIDDKYVYFKSQKSKGPNRVPREMIRKAIAYLLYKRCVTRRQVERFNHFSSFVMGFLRLAIVEILKIGRLQKLKNRMCRIVMKGIRFFFAGLDRDPAMMRLLNEYSQAPGNWVLLSYWYLRQDKNENWKRNARKYNCKVLLDSGEFSYYKARKKLREEQRKLATMVEGSPEWLEQQIVVEKLSRKVVPISIKEYAEFIKKHQDIIIGCFNLDVVGDPIKSKIHANYLRSQGINPIEIWHPQSGFEALDKLVAEEHELIAIGGLVFLSETERTQILDKVFSLYPDQPFHILGCSSGALFRYPIFSSDSTGPIMGRRYLNLITENGQVRANVECPWHDWTAEEALVFNIRKLSSLEEAYDGIQMEMVCPPTMKHEGQFNFF